MGHTSPLVAHIANVKTRADRNATIDFLEKQIGLFSERMNDEERSALRRRLLNGGFGTDLANDVGAYYFFFSLICGSDFWRPANKRQGHGAWFRWSDLAGTQREYNKVKKEICMSPFMSFYLDGVSAHMTNRFEVACTKFCEAAQTELGPDALSGVHTVPDYEFVWNLPDVSAPNLIEDDHFSPVFGRLPHSSSANPDLVFACDAKYFDKYFTQLAGTLGKVKRPVRSVHRGIPLSRHVTNILRPRGQFNVLLAVHEARRVHSLCLTAEEIQKTLPHINLVIFSVDTQPRNVNDLPALYAALRFYFLRYLLHQGRQRLLCYDVDVEFKDNYEWRLDRLLNEFDIGVFINRGVRSSVPWRSIAAGSFAIRNCFWSEYFLDLVLSYLNHQLCKLERAWFVDQQALFWVRQFCMRSVPGLRIGDIGEFGPQFKTRKLELK